MSRKCKSQTEQMEEMDQVVSKAAERVGLTASPLSICYDTNAVWITGDTVEYFLQYIHVGTEKFWVTARTKMHHTLEEALEHITAAQARSKKKRKSK